MGINCCSADDFIILIYSGQDHLFLSSLNSLVYYLLIKIVCKNGWAQNCGLLRPHFIHLKNRCFSSCFLIKYSELASLYLRVSSTNFSGIDYFSSIVVSDQIVRGLAFFKSHIIQNKRVMLSKVVLYYVIPSNLVTFFIISHQSSSSLTFFICDFIKFLPEGVLS